MKFLVPRERVTGEKRVAVTPETARRLQGHRIDIQVESGAGVAAGFPDANYSAVGASVIASGHLDWEGCDAVLCVQPPERESLAPLREGTLLVGLLAPHGARELAHFLNRRSV